MAFTLSGHPLFGAPSQEPAPAPTPAAPASAPAGPLPPLLNASTSLAQAIKGDTLGIGYAGGGFLVLYYIGVSKMLQQLGILKRGHYKTAGSSVGVLAQAVDYPGGVSHDEFFKGSEVFHDTCRAQRNCLQTLDKNVHDLITKTIKPDVWKVADGNACAVITWAETNQGDYICNYRNTSDVVDVIRAATFVPGWSSREKFVHLRGRPAFDGAFHQLLPCPPNVTYCIKVSASSPFDMQRAFEGLHDKDELSRTLNLVFSTISELAGPNPLETMAEVMRQDLLNTINLPEWLKFLELNEHPVADIYPGKFTRNRLNPTQALLYVFVPPDNQTATALYEMGQEDAKAWARSQGWPVGTRRRVV